MIFGGTRGYVFCIDEKTGREVWRTKLSTGIFGGAYGDVTVLVHEQTVIAGSDGHVWGVDSHSGDILWHNSLTGLGNNFVALADANSSVQYIHRHTSS